MKKETPQEWSLYDVRGGDSMWYDAALATQTEKRTTGPDSPGMHCSSPHSAAASRCRTRQMKRRRRRPRASHLLQGA